MWGRGGGAVVVVPAASSVFPLQLYVTLGPFRISGSVGGDRENRVLDLGRGSGSRDRYGSDKCRQVKELIEQQGESDMPASGQVQEDVSAEESVAQPQGAAAAVAACEQQQQQWHQPPPQQYADWFPMAKQFFRTLYQGAWQPGQAATGGQHPVPPPAVPKQQVDPQVEQLVVQQASDTGRTRADKAESWTHELERTFETMECTEEDQFQPYQQQQQFPQHQQPQQASQRGRGRGRVMALTREEAEASNLVIGDMIVVLRARRRWPFRGEGPNGSALLLERWFVPVFGVILGRTALGRSSAGIATAIEVTMVSRPARPPRHHHDALRRRDMVATALGVATFSSTHGTSASFLVRSYTSRSPGAWHLRACPVREVVTVAWDPHPRAPVEGVLRAASVLESRNLEQRGKRWPVSPFLIASLFVAPEPLREGKRGTVRLLSSSRARVGWR
ncbi:hypothetical protein Taro_008168, partial [Colocasia esculenta]|nr:hypothetical protein [Colocasia esculenta]